MFQIQPTVSVNVLEYNHSGVQVLHGPRDRFISMDSRYLCGYSVSVLIAHGTLDIWFQLHRAEANIYTEFLFSKRDSTVFSGISHFCWVIYQQKSAVNLTREQRPLSFRSFPDILSHFASLSLSISLSISLDK